MLLLIIFNRSTGILNLSICWWGEESPCSSLEAHLPLYSRKLELYALIDISLFLLINYHVQFDGSMEIIENTIGFSLDKLWVRVFVSPPPA